MSALGSVMGLLVLAYIGSLLVSGRTLRGIGLPSGSEYLLAGVVIGPLGLEVIRKETLLEMEPVVSVMIGWLALVQGLGFGHNGAQRASARSVLRGSSVALITMVTIAAIVYGALRVFRLAPEESQRIIALGTGVACTETTRRAIRWVVERHGAAGPISSLVADLADNDHLLPMVAIAIVFALPSPLNTVEISPLPIWAQLISNFILALVLAVAAHALLSREFRIDESWGVMLGIAVMGIGVSLRLQLSTLTVMFTTGVLLSALSKHRDDILAMISSTENAVLLPVLLVAGAMVPTQPTTLVIVVAALALTARISAKLMTGVLLRTLDKRLSQAAPHWGLSLMPSGSVAVCVGLCCAYRFGPNFGEAILVASISVNILGELLGPVALKNTLVKGGETTS